MSRTWYPRYPGDYARKTAHLSLTEDGAFAKLMDWYYANERPLPKDWVQLHRICKAIAPFEQDAVQAVVQQFFEDKPDGWHNRRADEEIVKKADISAKRREAQAERERKRLANGGARHGANAPAHAHTTTTTSTKESNNSLYPDNPRAHGVGVLKNDGEEGGGAEFAIALHLTPEAIQEAKAAAPGWDIYNLMNVYDDGIRSGKRAEPDYPDKAFPKWCARYTKGKRP